MLDALIAVGSWIWNAVQAVADAAIIALQFAWRVLKAFAGDIWDAAKWTYQTILKPVGEFLHKAYDKLKAVYDKVLKPIHAWAQRITKAVRQIYTTYFQPILSTIDALRRTLQLLKLLHVEWAAALDAQLAALERKISLPIQTVIQVVNAIDSRIESYVLTADNLFRKATLIGSVTRDLNTIANLQWNRGLSTLSQAQREGLTGMDDYANTDELMAFFESTATEAAADAEIDVEGALVFMELLADGTTPSMWSTG